jgi:Uncharacterised nucleotidyltransferase
VHCHKVNENKIVPRRQNPSHAVDRRDRSDLLLCCAICADDRDGVRRMLETRKDRIDWSALIEAAEKHRLEMLLYRALHPHFIELVDSSAWQALRRLYDDNVTRCRTMTAELLPLLDRLQREQIPAIPFKGPILAAQFYGDIALRVYGDLDILIRERDIAKATGIMLELGYRVRMDLAWERSFVRAPGESVDIHWAITERIHQFPLGPEDLWARRRTIALSGATVPTLCEEDALLSICFNGLTEDWYRFDRIGDVAEVVRRSSTIAWEEFLAMCRRRGCERLVLVGMHLAKELFLTKLPDCVEVRLQAHRNAILGAGYGIADFMRNSTKPRKGIEAWTYLASMRESFRDRIPYYQSIAYILFKPRDDDTKWRRASRQVLYRMLRLPLLGVRHGLKVLGRANLRGKDGPW